jgi:hypothetical protein
MKTGVQWGHCCTLAKRVYTLRVEHSFQKGASHMPHHLLDLAGIPENLPPKLVLMLITLARDSFSLRELWWFTVALLMIDNEHAWRVRTQVQDGRLWWWFRTRAGDEFPLPDPGLSEAQERSLLQALRDTSTPPQKEFELLGPDSPWRLCDSIPPLGA